MRVSGSFGIAVTLAFVVGIGLALMLGLSPDSVRADTSAPVAPNTPATGAPTISGSVQVGETLTADTSSIADADGLTSVTFSYQWIRNDGTTDTDIPSATSTTYQVVSDDVGNTIKLRVTFTDDAGNDESLTSPATAEVRNVGICNRTKQVREKIVRMVGRRDCSEVTESDLAGLNHVIELADLDIQALEADDFQGLVNLEGLDLRFNSLTELPEGIFNDLPKLLALWLNHNLITELPDGAFDNLVKLRGLRLHVNSLSELPEGIFDNNVKLEELMLGWNDLASLPDGVFDNQAKLRTLDLSLNKLTVLPDGVFDSLSQLRSLDILGNDLTALPDDAFDNLVRLQHLWLGGNDVRVLSDGIFDDLTKLEFLDLQQMSLSELPDDVFDNLAELETLYVQQNDLNSLPDGVFDSLTNLTILWLHQNSLTTLPDGIFDIQNALQTLTLDFNDLTELPNGLFDHMGSLVHLNLRDNSLRTLPDGIDNLSDLLYLNLVRNRLTALPEGIEELSRLRELYLSSNEISELPDGMFDGMTNLVILNLGSSGVTGLPENIENLAQLESLNLRKMEISELPEGFFSELSNLQELDLSVNNLSELPGGGFANLTNLRVLSLAFNNFAELPYETFDGVSSLHEFHLWGNPGVPFIYVVLLEARDASSVVVRMEKPAPFPVTARLTAVGGQLSQTSVNFPAGDSSTKIVTATRDSEGTTPITVSVQVDRVPDVEGPDWGSGVLVFPGEPQVLGTQEQEDESNGICDRTEAVRDAILAAIPDVEDCAEVSPNHLGNLGRLDLSESEITYLKAGDLDNLSGLTHLNLYGNDLTALSEGIFDDLTSLTSLNLASNNILNVSDSTFDNLTAITDLDINANRLKVLPDGVFDNLTSLSSLNLQSNHIGELPEGIFDNQAQLQRLDMGDNALSELPNGIFDNLGQLQVLDVGLNGLSGLPNGIFDNLGQLRELYLRLNDLTELPSDTLDNQEQLQVLDLSYNDLSELANGIFEGLSHLNRVNARGNTEDPFILTAGLEQSGVNGVVVKVAEATPFDMEVELAVDNGSLSTTTVTIPAGSSSSETVSVTPGEEDSVLVSVESANLRLGVGDIIYGIETGLGSPLALEVEEATDPPAVSSQNTPATGAPAISGTPEVGQTLAADTSGITDADGLANVAYSYQWVVNDGSTDTDLPGETGTSHLVTTDDVSKTLKVRVSFTDDAGNDETLTSASTTAVSAAVPGVPRSVAVEQGGTGELDVSWESPASNGGSIITGYKVQWKQATGNWDTPADVSEATASGTSYTISRLELDVEYAVRVIATNAIGDGTPTAEATATAVAQTSQQVVTQNNPATGAPTITGSVQVGETLTADTSGITDSDGITNATFSYQWLADDAAISGATESTYTLVAGDEGKAIKVKVSFTDDGGNDETLTSAATTAVEAIPDSHDRPYGLQATSGSGSITLTWQDPDTHKSYGYYQILRHRPELGEADPLIYVEYASTSDRTFIDNSVEPGVLYLYAVKAVKDPFGYLGPASDSVEVRMPQVEGPNSPASGVPEITGTVRVGETLTASTTGISDADGLTNATFSYQWLADDAAISGATGSTYTLVPADEGKAIKVRVSFTDDGGHDETLTSASTAVVSVPAPLTASFLWMPSSHNGSDEFWIFIQFSEEIASSDATLRDHALTVTGGEVVNAAAFGQPDLWRLLIDPDGNSDVTIALPITTDCSATGAICTRGGKRLSIHLTTAVPGPTPVNSPATGTLAISGTAEVGQTLTADTSGIADTDGLDGATFSYQWVRNDGTGDTDIQDATDSTYTLDAADEGKTIKVRVSFTDDSENEETLTSTATAVIAAKPNSPATGAPTISGTVQVGEALTADTLGIADDEGLDNALFSYQWLADESDIAGATGSSHTLTSSEEGMTIQVRVSFTDDADNAESLTSTATAAVAGTPPEPLTASLENTPDSHDGENVFTFELRFSEEFSLSYVTLRDHAFTVTGGTVKKAQRMDKPSNIHWRITVEPDSSATVTVVLPVTTDCADQGAVCTEDGRMLSDEVEFSVSGPGQ